MDPAQRLQTALDEYLESEDQAPAKSELVDGRAYAMAGAGYEHNVIVANVVGLLRAELRGRPCVALPSDMKVLVPGKRSNVYYPDATVVCGAPEFYGTRRDVLTNPSVVVEVLSASTERIDRGEKREAYALIPALTDYLLIASDRMRVEQFTAASGWNAAVYEQRGADAGARVVLAALGVELELRELYANVPLQQA